MDRCPECESCHLGFDRGYPDTWDEPGMPDMIFCHDCGWSAECDDPDEVLMLRQRIAELEAQRNVLQAELGNWMRIDAENHARLDAILPAIKDHVADLRKTADRLEAWQDPMVGPFDATITEIRKAADELEALEQK